MQVEVTRLPGIDRPRFSLGVLPVLAAGAVGAAVISSARDAWDTGYLGLMGQYLGLKEDPKLPGPVSLPAPSYQRAAESKTDFAAWTPRDLAEAVEQRRAQQRIDTEFWANEPPAEDEEEGSGWLKYLLIAGAVLAGVLVLTRR